MKKILLVLLILSMSLFAESLPDSLATVERGVYTEASVETVSLAPPEICPSDSMLSADYAKCKQALSIAVNAQMDRTANRDRSMEMASTAGSFLGGALIGFLLGWWLL